MFRMLGVLALGIGVLSIGNSTAFAQDVCREPKTLAERSICSDPDLRRLAEAIEEEYLRLLPNTSGPTRTELLMAQLRWRQDMDRCVRDRDTTTHAGCLRQALQNRLDGLKPAGPALDTGTPRAPATEPATPPPTVSIAAGVQTEVVHSEIPLTATDADMATAPLPDVRAETPASVEALVPSPVELDAPQAVPEMATPEPPSSVETGLKAAAMFVWTIISTLILTLLGTALVLAAIALAGGAYLFPTLVAFKRGHRNRWVICVVNVAFGYTLIGWVFPLLFALDKFDDPISKQE